MFNYYIYIYIIESRIAHRVDLSIDRIKWDKKFKMFYWITLFELIEEVIHLWYHQGGGERGGKSSEVPQGIQSDGLMQGR